MLIDTGYFPVAVTVATGFDQGDFITEQSSLLAGANADHVNRGQFNVMNAIERYRTAALGGHVARHEDCDHRLVAHNSCRDRHY